ncbi:MAG: hypothetical protein ACJ72R_11330 [Nitrososphaeraceae archaeon]
MGALHKAWKGYVIAKNKDEFDKMLHYARIIQECQYDLGRPVSSFHHIRMSALAFNSLCAAQIAQKNNSNSGNNNNQEHTSEEYLTNQQEERFTDDNAYILPLDKVIIIL